MGVLNLAFDALALGIGIKIIDEASRPLREREHTNKEGEPSLFRW